MAEEIYLGHLLKIGIRGVKHSQLLKEIITPTEGNTEGPHLQKHRVLRRVSLANLLTSQQRFVIRKEAPQRFRI